MACMGLARASSRPMATGTRASGLVDATSLPSCSYTPVHAWNGASMRPRRRSCARNPASNRQCVRLCAASSGRAADPVYMQEYQALKDSMLATTRKAGGAIAAYLLFTVSGTAAICALLGSAAGNLYLMWLFRDVDSINANTRVALSEANKIAAPLPRNVARIFAAWSHALQPRLLVLVGLAAGTSVWNNVPGLEPLDLVHQGCLLGGFLTYKVPLIIKIADDNVPKEYGSEEMDRPMIERFDDDLDRWGRPKKPLAPLPTDALPEGVDADKLGSGLEEVASIRSADDVAGLLKRVQQSGSPPPPEVHAPGAAQAAQPGQTPVDSRRS